MLGEGNACELYSYNDRLGLAMVPDGGKVGIKKRWPRVCQGEINPGPGGASGGLNNYISAKANGKPNPQANMFFGIKGKTLRQVPHCAIHFPSRAQNWRRLPIDRSEGNPEDRPSGIGVPPMPNPIASIGRRRGLFCRRSPSIFLLHNSKIPNPVNDPEHSLPLPDRFYISSGEGVVTVINA